MTKKFLLSIIACVCTTLSFAQLPADFFASEDISYDDNIYLTDTGKTESLISTTRLGANYETKIPYSGLAFKATAMGGYNAYSKQHNANNYWEAFGNAELSNDNFSIGDTFLYTSDPANNELTQRAKRINNNAAVSFKSSTDRTFGIGLSFSDVFDRYMKAAWEGLNRNRINAGVQLYYNMSPKTNFFAEYMYSNIDYQVNTNSNSNNNLFALGVNGTLAPKVTGTAKVTYEGRDYSHEVQGVDSYNDLFGYLVSIDWQATTRTALGISGTRTMEETTYENNRYFADSKISIYGTQKIFDRFTAGLSLSYENMNYQNADAQGVKRNDDLYTVRPSVDYQFMDWLSAGVWYQYRHRASNAPFDYDNNKAGVFVKGIF